MCICVWVLGLITAQDSLLSVSVRKVHLVSGPLDVRAEGSVERLAARGSQMLSERLVHYRQ